MFGLVTTSCQKWPPEPLSIRSLWQKNPQHKSSFARGSIYYVNNFSLRTHNTMKALLILPGISVVLAALTLSFTASAADKLEVQTGKAELVIPEMSPQDAVKQVKDALSSWATPASANLRALPSTIPARPDEPSAVQKYVSGTPVIEYQCRTAYAEIVKRPPPIESPFIYTAEITQACVYPFQKGLKVYILFTSLKRTESLTSGLFSGINTAIRGQDGDWMTGQLNDNIAAIKKNIPSLLVEKIEVPGMQVQEPDKASVAALIPAEVDAHAQVIVQAQTPPQAVAAASTANPMASKIEARKSLTAMGLTYHSQEQFIAAVRRKDDVAVQLFLNGGGVDLAAKEKSGKTPVDIAHDVGANNIAKMIADSINGPIAVVPSPQVSPVSAPEVPAQALDAAAKKKRNDEAFAALPPDIQAHLNAQLDSANLTPEQKEQIRAQAVAHYGSIKQFTNRVAP